MINKKPWFANDIAQYLFAELEGEMRTDIGKARVSKLACITLKYDVKLLNAVLFQ